MTKKGDNIKKYSAIITIDPSNLKSYIFRNNEIKPNKLTGFKKENFYISSISSKYLIMESIEISSSIADEDLDSAIDIQVYDELNFDPAIQYSIFYKEYTNSQESDKRKFNIFAVDTKNIEEEFKGVIDKVKYIDYILPEPLLIKSVYKKNLINKESVDCFLYFKEEDAFIAIYADGDYIYSKSINFSLKRMHEKFCELSGESYSYKDFIDFILSGYLENISKADQRLLVKLYKEIFVYVNDIIFYVKRAYQVENIDRIFINSTIGIFKNIDKYIRTYLDIEPHKLKFIIAKNQKEIKDDQMHNLMILSALDYMEDMDESLNFSLFKRPPPFRQRAIGRIFYTALFSIILSFLYPAYQLGYNYFLKIKLSKSVKKEHKLYIKALNIKRELTKLYDREKKIKSKLIAENKKLSFREKLLKQIYSKKIHYPMKIKLLSEIFEKMNKYKTKIYDFKISNDKHGNTVMHFFAFSRSDKNITELIKALTAIKKYAISTKEIKKDNKKRVYLSDIKVVLNEKG